MSRKLEINREKVCPFLLRLFWKENDYTKLEDYEQKLDSLSEQEVQIYTWKDATLRELVELIQSAIPCAKKRDAKFRFSAVYQDPRGHLKRRDLGTIKSYKTSNEDNQNLQDLRFFVGDYIDLTIMTENKNQKP